MSVSFFAYDVFLSHSSKDKAVVHQLAERLKADGVRVWLDAWEIRPGDSIPRKIEESLEHSAVLVLCMSANAFGSDWAALESQTFRFRDPLNKERRFIASARRRHAEGHAHTIRLRRLAEKGDQAEYSRLLQACRPHKPQAERNEHAVLRQFEEKVCSLGHMGWIRSVAFSPDGKCAFSSSKDNTVRLWDVHRGRALRVFEGHTGQVRSVAFSPDGKRDRGNPWGGLRIPAS